MYKKVILIATFCIGMQRTCITMPASPSIPGKLFSAASATITGIPSALKALIPMHGYKGIACAAAAAAATIGGIAGIGRWLYTRSDTYALRQIATLQKAMAARYAMFPGFVRATETMAPDQALMLIATNLPVNTMQHYTHGIQVDLALLQEKREKLLTIDANNAGVRTTIIQGMIYALDELIASLTYMYQYITKYEEAIVACSKVAGAPQAVLMRYAEIDYGCRTVLALIEGSDITTAPGVEACCELLSSTLKVTATTWIDYVQRSLATLHEDRLLCANYMQLFARDNVKNHSGIIILLDHVTQAAQRIDALTKRLTILQNFLVNFYKVYENATNTHTETLEKHGASADVKIPRIRGDRYPTLSIAASLEESIASLRTIKKSIPVGALPSTDKHIQDLLETLQTRYEKTCALEEYAKEQVREAYDRIEQERHDQLLAEEQRKNNALILAARQQAAAEAATASAAKENAEAARRLAAAKENANRIAFEQLMQGHYRQAARYY